MYGTQAAAGQQATPDEFENDVKMYGTQASTKYHGAYAGLRMM